MSLRARQIRYWTIVSAVLIVVVLLTAWVWRQQVMRSTGQAPTPTPSYSTLTAPLATSSPSESSDLVSAIARPEIAPSIPVRMRVPSVGLDATILSVACPLDANGDLHPATLGEACYYTTPDKPYELPGTTTHDVSVLAGHTCRWCGDAVFNPLYDWQNQQFRVKIGDELWLKTEKSGEQWLVYRAIATYTPKKGSGTGSLRESTEIWGAAPKPNRLLTIGCLQPNDGAPASSENIVIEWEFADVASTP